MDNKEKLKKYIEKYWSIIPCLSNIPTEGMKQLIANGETYNTGNPNEYLCIKRENDNSYSAYIYYVIYDKEKQIQNKTPITKMKLKEDGKFYGIMLRQKMKFTIEADGEVEINFSNSSYIKAIIDALDETKTIVTREDEDLDNKASIYAIENWLKNLRFLSKDETLTIEKVPKGNVKQGFFNIDIGKNEGNELDKNGTVVIDKDTNIGIKSTSQELEILGIPIPEQIIKLTTQNTNEFNSRAPMSFIEFLTGEQIFSLADNWLLDKELSDEQLEKYGLIEAYNKKMMNNFQETQEEQDL